MSAESNISLKGGVKYTTISTIVLAAAQIVTMAFLARLLSKEDFGLIAITVTVKGFADLYTDFGFSTGILHFKNISERVYSTLYWTGLILSILCFILLWVLSPLITNFYGFKELNILIPLMALGVPFSAIGSQQRIYLQKEFRFKEMSIVEIIAALLYMISAILLAYLNYGVYSLVFSNLIRYLVLGLLFFFIARKYIKIRFLFKFSEIIPFLKIGVYKVIGQTINYFSSSFDILIIGKLMGASILGIYNLAKDIVLKPAALIEPVIVRVFTPYFSVLQDTKDKLIHVFDNIQKHISMFNGVVYFALAALAVPLVDIYYGLGNREVAYVLSILSLFYFIRSYGSPISMLCVAKGRTDVDMYWNIISLLVITLFTYLGARISIYAVGVFLIIQILLMTPLAWQIYVKPLLDIGFTFYYSHLFKSFIVFILPTVLISLFNFYFGNLHINALIIFLIEGIIYLTGATATMYLIDRRYFKSLIVIVKNYGLSHRKHR